LSISKYYDKLKDKSELPQKENLKINVKSYFWII